jgi:hypothetical protein
MADKHTINGSDRWADVTPSDTVNLPEVPRAIHIGVAGNVVLVGSDGTACTFAVNAGQTYPYQPVRINSTSTTATGIKALY